MKIVLFEIEDWEKPHIEKALSAHHELVFEPSPLTPEIAHHYKDAEIISVFVTTDITSEVLEKMPNLVMIATRSTGYDHIDLSYCKKKKITVCNVPHYGTHAVSEYTFALILALARRMYESVDRTRQGDFDHKNLRGIDLHGKTIGIVGLGDIGTHVMKIAKGFGMKVVATAHHPNEALARKLGITFLDLKELIEVSDVITLHAPYTKETHHMINKKNIKKFKKGSLLINTARGPLIQTEAIIYGLEKGILAGVGLDVLEEENVIKEERQILTNHYLKDTDYKTLYFNHILMGKDNVIITPHNAFNTEHALQTILDVTVQNIEDFIDKDPQNVV